MHNYCINKLIDLKEVNVKKIIHSDSKVKIYIETKASPQVCPSCGQTAKHVHDYRYQSIKDLPLQLKHCYLVLKKRRYRCPCGKRFFEKYDFLARYQQRSTRLTKYIVNELRNTVSLKTVAQKAYSLIKQSLPVFPLRPGIPLFPEYYTLFHEKLKQPGLHQPALPAGLLLDPQAFRPLRKQLAEC